MIPRHGYVVLHPHEHRRHAAKFVQQGRHKFVVAEEILGSTAHKSKAEARLITKSTVMLRNIGDVAAIVGQQLRREKKTAIAKELADVQARIDVLIPKRKDDPEAATKLAALIRLRDQLKRLR